MDPDDDLRFDNNQENENVDDDDFNAFDDEDDFKDQDDFIEAFNPNVHVNIKSKIFYLIHFSLKFVSIKDSQTKNPNKPVEYI